MIITCPIHVETSNLLKKHVVNSEEISIMSKSTFSKTKKTYLTNQKRRTPTPKMRRNTSIDVQQKILSRNVVSPIFNQKNTSYKIL